ncbi:MAG: hypothetical protein ABI364_09855, partial [Caldimonas sp.]
TCAGGEAQLVPASRYASEMMRTLFGNDTKAYVAFASHPRYPARTPPGFSDSIRRVGCDAQGGFRFDAVPAGNWFVFSNVGWRGAGDAPPQGGMLMQRIDVAAGAQREVVLTP